MADIDHNRWTIVKRNARRLFGVEIVVNDDIAGPDGVALLEDDDGQFVAIGGGERMLINFQHAMVALALAKLPAWSAWCLSKTPMFFQSWFFRLTARIVLKKVAAKC